MVKLLLAKVGVDPNSRDKNGRTQLRWTKKYGYEAMVNLLQVHSNLSS
jgi:ankyrin repeat protein